MIRAKIYAAALLLSACSAPSGALPRFHEVDPGRVYRSAQPNAEGYEEMVKAGIRTVIKLNTDLGQEEHAWAEKSGIYLIEIDTPGLFAPSYAAESSIQAALSNPALQPVLVHCEQGRDRTGLAIALYRMNRQGWAPEAAHKEWLDLGHSIFLRGMDDFFWEQVSHSSKEAP